MPLPALMPILNVLGTAAGGLYLFDFMERHSGPSKQEAIANAMGTSEGILAASELLGIRSDESLSRNFLGMSRAIAPLEREIGRRQEFNELAYVTLKQKELERLSTRSTPSPLEMVAAAREVAGL
jgi:hypothetical protein